MLVSGKSVLLGTSNARLFGTIRYWKIPNQNYLLRYWTQFFCQVCKNLLGRLKAVKADLAYRSFLLWWTERNTEKKWAYLGNTVGIAEDADNDDPWWHYSLDPHSFCYHDQFLCLILKRKTKNNPSSYYLIANKREDKRLFLLYRVTKQYLSVWDDDIIYTVFENRSKSRIWIFVFSPFKSDLSGNTVWPQASGFQKLPIFWHFFMNFYPLKM